MTDASNNPTPPATTANAARFAAYLDGTMSAEESAAFEVEIGEDAALEAEFEAYVGGLEGLDEPALDAASVSLDVDLTEGVKSRIRRRSRGRYFGRHSAQRERTQIHLFLLCAIGLLIGAAIIARPDVLAALFDDAEFVNVDEEDEAPTDDEAPTEGTGPTDGAAPTDAAPTPAPAPGTADDEAPPADPTAELTPEALAAQPSRVGNGAIRPMRHMDYAYVVTTELDEEALLRRLNDQFGRDAVARDGDNAFRVTLAAGDLQATLPRVSDLGVVGRELAPADPTRTTRDLVFLAAPEGRTP